MGILCRRVGYWVLVVSTLRLLGSSPPSLVPNPIPARSLSALGDSWDPVLSDDGRFVVFLSTAEDLGASPNKSGAAQVFIRDRQTGTTELVSATPEGKPGNRASTQALISGDGQIVTFVSRASDLTPGDSNSASDIFVRNLATGTTRLVSQIPSGSSGNGHSWNPSIAGDGQRIVFESLASDLVAQDTNGFSDIFLFDADTGVVSRVSKPSNSRELAGLPSGPSRNPFLSADGTTILFTSTAENLAPLINVGGIRRNSHLFVARPVGADLVMVNVFTPDSTATSVFSSHVGLSEDGQFASLLGLGIEWLDLDTGMVKSPPIPLPTGAFGSRSLTPALNRDGSVVILESQAAYAAGGTRAVVHAWDISSETLSRISTAGYTNAPNVDPPQFAEAPFGEFLGASPDSEFIAFLGGTLDDPPTDRPARQLILLRRSTGEYRRISRTPSGDPVDRLDVPVVSFSHSGRLAAFSCRSAALAPNDLNNAFDVFLYDWDTDSIELISTAHPDSVSTTDSRTPVCIPTAISADGHMLLILAAEESFTESNAGFQVYRVDLHTGLRTLVSVNAAGTGPGNQACSAAVMSVDARFVAFTSTASNLVEEDPNKGEDVFLRDVLTGSTTMASRGAYDLEPGDLNSRNPLVSPDGLWTAFVREAPGGRCNVWLYDSISQSVSVVTTNAAGSTPQGRPGSIPLAFTPDGSELLFAANATDLVEPPLNGGRWYVFTHNISDGQTRVLSSESSIAGSSAEIPEALIRRSAASVDPSGRYVAFPRGSDLSLYDRATAEARVVAEGALTPSVSADSRFIAYQADVQPNPFLQVFAEDHQTGKVMLASVSWESTNPGNGSSWDPLLTADGRFVVFTSAADNLVTNDTNGSADIFIRDLVAKTTTLVSLGTEGRTGRGISAQPLLSRDGRTLVFTSTARDLVEGDYNQVADLFMVRLPSAESDFRVAEVRRLDSPSLTLAWVAQEGISYGLEFSVDLQEPAWRPLDIPITVEGNQATATDVAPPGSPRRYYRLVEFPSP